MRVTHTNTSSPEQRFGEQVKHARESRGWSQEALARHLREAAGLDLHQTAVARLERGERTIRLNEVAALAQLLGLDLQPYSAGIPRLTSEEYEHARESLERLREQEEEARRLLAQMRERWNAVGANQERKIRQLADSRLRLAQAILEYEERQGG